MAVRLRESVALRLTLFAAGLVVIGGVAALAGAAVGGKPAAPGSARAITQMAGMDAAPRGPAELARVNGLAVTAAGYTFAPEHATLKRGKNEFRFRIVDAAGRAQRSFDLDGGVRLHLIVVRRDFAGYQHLHPTLAADGTWSVPLRIAAPGAYRAYADFDVDGKKTVLGYELFVPGSFTPGSLPPVTTQATVDGYHVALAHHALRAGKEMKLQFLVGQSGHSIQSFESYVGHRGHLVALREGDLAYSHVHPEPTGQPGEIVFHSVFATAGNYRLFLQFKLGGVVHTAPFTVEVGR